jgi:hypothetical protein
VKMRSDSWNRPLEQAAVVISLDSEQIWGYLDVMDERQFSARFPDVYVSYDYLLNSLCSAGISATWLVVGGLALQSCKGNKDPRLSGLPQRWVEPIPAGNETSAPLWYWRSFVQRLAITRPKQDVGLHGGLTHLIWSSHLDRPDILRIELERGLDAFSAISLRPLSFSFPRNGEGRHDLLASHGFLCYRGRAPRLSQTLGRNLPGALIRAIEELGSATPRPVWPMEAMPGLWNIPSSLYLYPIGDSRTRFVPLRTRLKRVELGLEAAIRSRGVFHFCLHPANLAESQRGWPMFDSMLELLVRARRAGDIEILTMTQLASLMAARKEREGLHESIRQPTADPIPVMRLQRSSSGESGL